MRSNLKYGKNQKREDVKSHHYIISFDPRDAQDNGLTVDRAQQLGEQFCKEHFPGHQALVCTHPDGHNHSGNIHVHIVINSLRIEEVPLLPYMVCVAIYAVLVQNIATDEDTIAAIWSCVGYTVLLCLTLFKSGSMAKAIFQAH